MHLFWKHCRTTVRFLLCNRLAVPYHMGSYRLVVRLIIQERNDLQQKNDDIKATLKNMVTVCCESPDAYSCKCNIAKHSQILYIYIYNYICVHVCNVTVISRTECKCACIIHILKSVYHAPNVWCLEITCTLYAVNKRNSSQPVTWKALWRHWPFSTLLSSIHVVLYLIYGIFY